MGLVAPEGQGVASLGATQNTTEKLANVFRPVYRQLEATEQQLLDDIKGKAQELYDLFPQTPDGRGAGREISLAMTKLEEVVMWAVKGITR